MKEVPLVIYNAGVRTVLGSAVLKPGGEVESRFNEGVELDDALRAGMVIGYSLAQFREPENQKQ